MWAFSNTTYPNYDRDIKSRIMESQDAGNGWSNATILPALQDLPAINPQVIFNETSGEMLRSRERGKSGSNERVRQSIFFDLGNGSNQSPTQNWDADGLDLYVLFRV